MMTNIDPQAVQLNDRIKKVNPAVFEMLSEKGKAIYFPKQGILSQAAEARGKEIDATIGTALEDNGQPMCLPSISKNITLPAANVFNYAPSPGRPELRTTWKQMIGRKNPSISGKTFSQPVVCCALTHGLSMCAYLFGNEGDELITPDLYWENYDLLFTNGYGVRLVAFPTFNARNGFNVAGLKSRLHEGPSIKKIVALNFPNNPTGYTPTEGEIREITQVLLEAANAGKRIVVLIDDAYFGLVFEKGIYTESIFSQLCDLHPNILAVKIDGATKEDYVWGFRVGFITYGIKGGTPELYEALESKTGGAIRGNISSAPNPTQSLLVTAYTSPTYDQEKREKFEILRKRYDKIKQILAAHPEYEEQFEPLPFNSGYFMCIKPKRANAEKLRQKLLSDYSTGVIAFSGVIRLAFSATPLDKLEKLFENVYQAAKSLS